MCIAEVVSPKLYSFQVNNCLSKVEISSNEGVQEVDLLGDLDQSLPLEDSSHKSFGSAWAPSSL